jgi:hypothetical protein
VKRKRFSVGAAVYFGPETIFAELLIGAEAPLDGAHVLSSVPVAFLAAPFTLFGDGVFGIGENCF